jgi:hypothetical protein
VLLKNQALHHELRDELGHWTARYGYTAFARYICLAFKVAYPCIIPKLNGSFLSDDVHVSQLSIAQLYTPMV